MSDVIKIKRGNGTSTLADGELGCKTNEKALYIGIGGKNVRLCGAGDVARLEKLIEDITARLDAMTPSE